jgi:hypothetical protein
MEYDDVAEFYGNASKAAEKLGLTRQAVSKWRTRGIPFEQQFRIQLKTKGRLKASIADLNRRYAA